MNSLNMGTCQAKKLQLSKDPEQLSDEVLRMLTMHEMPPGIRTTR